MPTRSVRLALLVALEVGCKGVECGEGTTERDGSCVPASETVKLAKCGPFTELQGDTCVPTFPPTLCDPASTQPDTDGATGVTTCVGTGAASCAAKLPCPTPSDGKQAICGQLYDFETGQPFAQAGATGAACADGATSGPCAVTLQAYDAAAFASSGGAARQLATGAVYVDDCGRYRIPEVAQPTLAPLIALGVDDTAQPGPAGVANPAGVAIAAAPNTASKDVELFVVRPATVSGWTGPSLATGIFAAVFRGHASGDALAPGVTVTRNGASDGANDYYFAAGATTRTTLDGAATATGDNGTALLTIANPQLTDVYSGSGGLPANCAWEAHGGAAVPGVVFIQIFRPMNAAGSSCTL